MLAQIQEGLYPFFTFSKFNIGKDSISWLWRWVCFLHSPISSIELKFIKKGTIPLSVVESLVGDNTSLVEVYNAPASIRYFADLNSICEELNARIYLFSMIWVLVQVDFFEIQT